MTFMILVLDGIMKYRKMRDFEEIGGMRMLFWIYCE